MAPWYSGYGVGLATRLSPVRFPAAAASTWMGDRLRAGKLSQYAYFTEPPKPTQPPTLGGTGNEYRGQSAVMLCGWGVKAGWLCGPVDKRVSGR